MVLRGGRMRRESIWFDVAPVNFNLGAALVPVVMNSLNAAAQALRPFTVVRTRGFYHVRSDQNAADETYHAAIGACVVSDQAVAIGVTAVPTPNTDRASDLWFVYEELGGRYETFDFTGVAELGQWKDYDSRESQGL